MKCYTTGARHRKEHIVSLSLFSFDFSSMLNISSPLVAEAVCGWLRETDVG